MIWALPSPPSVISSLVVVSYSKGFPLKEFIDPIQRSHRTQHVIPTKYWHCSTINFLWQRWRPVANGKAARWRSLLDVPPARALESMWIHSTWRTWLRLRQQWHCNQAARSHSCHSYSRLIKMCHFASQRWQRWKSFVRYGGTPGFDW